MSNIFKFIIPVYNAEKYVEKCLLSVKNQSYKNWQAIIVNDASTDSTEEKILNVITDDSRFVYIKNNINKQVLYNYFTYIPKICQDDNDIVIFLDGDDWLYNDIVLEYLNEIYTENIWVTYGQYITASDNKIGCCGPVLDIRQYRRGNKEGWKTSHPKTCRYFLWKQINVKELQDKNGKFIPSPAADLCFMFSLLEMATDKHTRFIDKTLYVYNNLNVLNGFKKEGENQETWANYSRTLSIYKPYYKKMDMLYTFQFETDHIQKAFNRLVCSINSLQNQNLNIIVLNGSYKDIIKDLKLNVNRELAYVHKYNYKKGSKGKLINHGAKHFVKSDFFFISDIDLIYPPNFIEEFNNLDLYENDIPKRIVFDSYFLRKELYNFNHRLLLRELKEHNTHTPAPGNGLIHRNSFLYLRGFNEDMLGWGFEDTVFNLRIGKINIYREYDHIRTVHLWHERTNSIQEQKNNQMFLNYKNIFMTDDEKYKKYLIANNKDKWGEY